VSQQKPLRWRRCRWLVSVTLGLVGSLSAGWVRAAHGDVWQVLGVAGVAEFPGVRVMATGLAHPQWNNGDVHEPRLVDLRVVGDWYAQRDVPWGLRLPAGAEWPHGRKLFTQPLMGMIPAMFRPVAPVDGVVIHVATRADLPDVVTVDAIAFEQSAQMQRPWLELLLAHPAVTVAIAEYHGQPIATGSVTVSSGRAGPAAYLGGIAVLPAARRQGIGAAVSSWLIDRGRDAGAVLWHLHPTHEAAASMYHRLGFLDVQGVDIYVDLT